MLKNLRRLFNMEQNIAVKIDSVAKSFQLPVESTNSLKRAVVNYFKGIKGYRTQEVLRNISFEIKKGEFFGIIGRNGSGKSTLLKIISEIYVPEKGTVEIDGKLVSFIELGVGFNPELTGKENVYLNGAMLGFSKAEIDDMYGDIVQFAELEDFMNQKLKNYSSGMQVRLAFAVAIQAKSDILVLDEVLAVGDEAFQRKCNDYFMEMKKSDKTIILVTHSMDAVRKYCDRAVLIDRGLVKVIGTPDEVANQYSLDNVLDHSHATVIDGQDQVQDVKQFVSNLSVELLSPTIVSAENRQVSFRISYEVLEEIDTYVAFSLTDIDRNVWLYNDNSLDDMTHGKGKKQLVYTCSLEHINPCKLKLSVSVRNEKREMIALTNGHQEPVLIVGEREGLSEREKDSSTGIMTSQGSFEIKG